MDSVKTVSVAFFFANCGVFKVCAPKKKNRNLWLLAGCMWKLRAMRSLVLIIFIIIALPLLAPRLF